MLRKWYFLVKMRMFWYCFRFKKGKKFQKWYYICYICWNEGATNISLVSKKNPRQDFFWLLWKSVILTPFSGQNVLFLDLKRQDILKMASKLLYLS